MEIGLLSQKGLFFILTCKNLAKSMLQKQLCFKTGYQTNYLPYLRCIDIRTTQKTNWKNKCGRIQVRGIMNEAFSKNFIMSPLPREQKWQINTKCHSNKIFVCNNIMIFYEYKIDNVFYSFIFLLVIFFQYKMVKNSI